MPRQFGLLDASATDSRWKCRDCEHRHKPGSPCPSTGIWLVRTGCTACWRLRNTERYCTRHDLTRPWG